MEVHVFSLCRVREYVEAAARREPLHILYILAGPD